MVFRSILYVATRPAIERHGMGADESDETEGAAEPPAVSDKAAIGAERYIWVYAKRESVVLSVPGVRDLEFSFNDAREVADSMNKSADDAEHWHESHMGDPDG
ncbi:hypothetical protein Q5530_34915 [Saccharothrix sp. BKS2]|uniref:hypothetical protein n=1 Tax=Saccharothrix sp. BKS2 TaxID=3064400 RepID=UPI0039E9A836